jgi:transitional endoplasmic reticulum ATPase
MDNEFRVLTIDSRLDITQHFQQTPKYEAQLSKAIANKLGFVDGELIEITGKRTTAARVVSIEKDDFDGELIGLNDFMRNNARISLKETVTIRKAEPKTARKIVLAPIGKYLKKSELLKIVAKKSFLDKPFVEGDVTYLRSKIMRYLLGTVTWMRVVKTEPDGVVVASDSTEFEVTPDPITLTEEDVITEIPDLRLEEDFSDKDVSLDDREWEKINGLIELGLFKSLTEGVTFFVREGMKARSDIFDKSLSVLEQLKQLKQNVKIST